MHRLLVGFLLVLASLAGCVDEAPPAAIPEAPAPPPPAPEIPLPEPFTDSQSIEAAATPYNFVPPTDAGGGFICQQEPNACVEYSFESLRNASVEAVLTWSLASNDFDLYLFAEDAARTETEAWANSGDVPGGTLESFQALITPGVWTLVVVPWLVATDAFQLDVDFLPARNYIGDLFVDAPPFLPDGTPLEVVFKNCEFHQHQIDLPAEAVTPLLPAGFQPQAGHSVADNRPPVATAFFATMECPKATTLNATLPEVRHSIFGTFVQPPASYGAGDITIVLFAMASDNADLARWASSWGQDAVYSHGPIQSQTDDQTGIQTVTTQATFFDTTITGTATSSARASEILPALSTTPLEPIRYYVVADRTILSIGEYQFLETTVERYYTAGHVTASGPIDHLPLADLSQHASISFGGGLPISMAMRFLPIDNVAQA